MPSSESLPDPVSCSEALIHARDCRTRPRANLASWFGVSANFGVGLLLLLIVGALAPAAAVSGGSPATNVRVQNILKAFVGTSGQEAIGLGSWISGKTYADVLAGGASDHDIRLISNALTPADAQREWIRARATLSDMVKREFGKDAAKVLKSINLYPPSQLMRGVEDASDALGRFRKLGNVPNLGFTGAVAAAPAQFAEGLYGSGAKAWTQAYEQQAGRIFYARDGKVFTGFTDLTHMSEGIARYDVAGMCNTSTQWAEHIVEELHEGRGDKVAKYLERLDRDLAKARSLARVELDPAWRQQVKKLAETLKRNPGKAGELQGEINAVLARSRGEASLLTRMTRAPAAERKILQNALKELRGGGRFSQILTQAGEVVTFERALTAISVILQVRQTAKFAGEEEYHQAVSSALAGVAGIASFPVGFVGDMTNWVMESAKANGYAFAASTQEAWDLMAGIHTAVGRTDVEDRGYTLDELVARIDDEKKLEAVVYTKARNAASRGFGGAETGKTDEKVGDEIFARCWPIIRDAWRERREELTLEYTAIMDELEHAPVLLKYAPVPLSVKPKEKVTVTVAAEMADPKFAEKLARAKQILTILYREGVFADVEWKWKGGRAASDKTKRIYEFDTAGSHAVTLAVKINAGAANARIGQVLSRKFELQSGIDVLVEAAQPDFEYPFMSCSVRISGEGVINKRGLDDKIDAPARIEFTMGGSDLKYEWKDNTFVTEYFEVYREGCPARVRLEGNFNEKRTVIENLTITWEGVRDEKSVEVDIREIEKSSFTAVGIPLKETFDGERLLYSVSFRKLEDRPPGFQLLKADYLYDSRRAVRLTFDANGNRMEDVITERKDRFRFDRAGVSISIDFFREPMSDPPPPMSEPR